jgi:hypothetical protein
LGAAIIYYGNTDSAFKLGLIVAALSIKKGMDISREGYEESTTTLKQQLDPSTRYRFVRYLPEYLWLGWSDQPIAYPVELRTSESRVVVQHPTISNGVHVSVAYVPDARQPCSYRIGNTSVTVEPLPDETDNCSSSPPW